MCHVAMKILLNVANIGIVHRVDAFNLLLRWVRAPGLVSNHVLK